MQRSACRAIFAVTMAQVHFSKWQGTGNDFILIDDRAHAFPSADLALVRRLCDRHFGIGSDGLILLQGPRADGMAYHMEFFNPDGSRSFCGNGSRCAFAFHSALTGHRAPVHFTAVDGSHTACWNDGMVSIGMRDVEGVEHLGPDMDHIFTGSPHLLCWVEDPQAVDLVPAARAHRYGPRFGGEGVNVNFLRWKDGRVEMRTYERGVEAETLSCGTGVTAAALSAMSRGAVDGPCPVRTPGGDLRVEATRADKDRFTGIVLSGPVGHVFSGEVDL